MRIYLLLFPLLLLTACKFVTVNISHVETTKGYLNSGIEDLGQLYLFDMETDFFTKLEVIPIPQKTYGKQFRTQYASDISGFKINGNLEKAVEANIRAEVAANSSIEISNAQRVSGVETITALSSFINGQKEKRNLGTRWKLDAASEEKSALRLAMVYATVNADQATARHANAVSTGGGFKVPFGWGGEADVKVEGLSQEQFSGDQVPVFVEYYVFKVFKNKSGNYDFDLRGAAEEDRLIGFLRD